MKFLRVLLIIILTPAVLAVWFYREPILEAMHGKPIPRLDVQVAVTDPYAQEGLEGYRAYRDALAGGDLEQVAELAGADDSYLALRASLTLARHWSLDAGQRLPHYLRAQELRVHDSLARAENRSFLLELASTAEAAGADEVAISNYRAALPADEAVSALERLIDDPFRLAGAYQSARLHSLALETLGELSAPSIEAPAHRALGNHEQGLAAYEAWLAQEPGNGEALSGRAWSNFYLNNNEDSDAQFAELAGSNALYGRALLANRAGDLTAATDFLFASGDAYHLWLATDLLERAGREQDALRFYLRLGAGGSAYADQAAYRALVVSGRTGDTAARQEARSLIDPGGFFALVLGDPLELPAESEPVTAESEPEILGLAASLARAMDVDAGIGELLFALRASDDPAEKLILAETLQAYGEFRHSRVAAQEVLAVRPDDRNVWRLAWPEAFPDEVRAQAQDHGIEAEWIWAIMRQESAFYPLAVSTSNARGLMQVVPSTWDWLAELQNEPPADVFDVSANIRYGAYYLDWLLRYFDGDLELATASYNRGQGYIGRLFDGEDVAGDKPELYRQIDAQETRNYLERVIVNYHIYLGLSQDLVSVPSQVALSALASFD